MFFLLCLEVTGILIMLKTLPSAQAQPETFVISDPNLNRNKNEWNEWMVKFDDNRENKGIGKLEPGKRLIVPQIRPEELMDMISRATKTHLQKEHVQEIAPAITDHRQSKMHLTRDTPSSILWDHQNAVERALKEFSKQLTEYLEESSELLKRPVETEQTRQNKERDNADKFLDRKISELKSTSAEQVPGVFLGPPIRGWDEWSDWSACSTSCGDGTQHRWRYCLQQSGCQGYNKQTRKCNSFSCNGVVAPLTLEDKRYFHPSQWERVPGRESAWRLKPNSYMWLPAAELPFPTNYFKKHFALLLSLRIDPKKQAGGTLFSLRSRRQEECYFAVEVAGQDAIKLVHSGPNGTQSVLIPALMNDGKWHRLALGIQDDSSVRSYFDCRWVSTDILKKNSLDIPEDADLVIGYLFAGELEDMILVGDPSGVAQQCSTNLTPSLDPILEAARPHKRPRKVKLHATKPWLPPALQTNRIYSDDEDFEGSGYSNSEFEWSEWSECNATCGTGVQFRTSICSETDCQPSRHTRPCVASASCSPQKSKDKCACMNGGLCKKRTGECKCTTGWEGPACEFASCRPRCRNGGSCLRPGVCQCSEHFTGSICQTPICEPPCRNGGHCVGNNQCLCPPNTNGDYCQNFTCGEGCKNGGTCVGPGLCECPHNSTGDHCQEPMCDPPCENGATCAPGNTCLCQPHSSGPRCHEKKCEYRPVQEPYVRGYRRLLLKKHFESKCDPRDWKSCVKSVPEYQNVYERAYRTSYKCVDQP